MSPSTRPAPAGTRVTLDCGGSKIEIETGRIARQATAAVIVRQNRAVVLVTVMAAREARPGSDFLPLTVEYREKAAAAGRIPGSFLRREGRITDPEVLASRILDRSLRPLFPRGFRNEVQVQASVLSADVETTDAPMLALLGAAAALHLSWVPWAGPLAGSRFVRSQGRVLAAPTASERVPADVELVVSASRSGLVMVEGGASNVADADVLEVLLEAQRRLEPLLDGLDELRRLAGEEKHVVPEGSESEAEQALRADVRARGAEPLRQALRTEGKLARKQALAATRARVTAELTADVDLRVRVSELLRDLTDELVRERVFGEQRRLDGRGPEDIRPIECEVDWLPTPHGSAIFTRGETQALVTCTLASKRSEQMVETLAGVEMQQFLLHYNFPPYSVGEIRPLRGPGRREIGHGALAHRALLPVMPGFREFPYVIRIESEISESNGSSSMATTCGGCLALMDAGVPVKAMVAGIAMGLISDGQRHVVLSDILGDEDHLGDMDFKVTGSATGITALQMDNKIGALPVEVLRQALSQAHRGRLHILGEMARALAAPRVEPKEMVPRTVSVRVAAASRAELIGPKGATIREIQESCQAEINIDDSGYATVFAADRHKAREAVRRIRSIAGIVREGATYHGTVTSVKDFGAFVRIFQSAEGLVHVSEWDPAKVESMAQVAKPGDAVVVRVLGTDDRGRLRLSRKAALGAPVSDFDEP